MSYNCQNIIYLPHHFETLIIHNVYRSQVCFWSLLFIVWYFVGQGETQTSPHRFTTTSADEIWQINQAQLREFI